MLDQYIIDLVAVVRVPLLPKACGRGWRKLRPSVALSVGLAWRFASASGGENVGPRTHADLTVNVRRLNHSQKLCLTWPLQHWVLSRRTQC
jgi:hypothetical protein